MSSMSVYGIEAYYKGSLNFSIIGGKLILSNGAFYDEAKRYDLREVSYVVLDKIDLTFFENYKTYYFYIAPRSKANRFLKGVLTHTVLEEEIIFFVTSQQYNDCTLLGEIKIDYGEVGNRETIALAKNVFNVHKNEIDFTNVVKYYNQSCPSLIDDFRIVSMTILELSEVLYKNMLKSHSINACFLSQCFFQFSENIKYGRYTPFQLYEAFLVHIGLLSRIDMSTPSEMIQKTLDEIDFFLLYEQDNYRTSFYHLYLDQKDSWFGKVLILIGNLTDILKKNISSDNNEHGFPTESKPLDSQNDSKKSLSDEENHATVLLGGEKERSYIQVGRGTRSGNDIVIGQGDKTVSRVHLRITAHKQGYFLEDLSSMGTYVDGERIEKNVKKFVTLKHRIVLGKKNCILDLNDVKIQALSHR